ncbi:MAG: hypothetical protein KDK24_16665 [Pseudooceanicola sp.]|nr:hypothetical protein [Pseudooceanicola sp.]
MISRRRLTAWAGQAAALLFAAMWVILQWHVRPVAGEIPLPQSNLLGYSNADLVALAQNLGPEVLATYKAILTYLDPAFIACFAAFFVLMTWPRRWAMALILAYVAADLTENRLILTALEGPVPLPVQQGSAAYLFTLVKFVLFAGCAVALIWTWRRNVVSRRGGTG